MNQLETKRLQQAQRVLVACWLLLVAILGAWLASAYRPVAAILLGGFLVLPLLLPLPGLVSYRPRTLRWAPLTLAPALAWTITEVLADPSSRAFAAGVLGALLLAFAAVIACLRLQR